MSGSSGNMPMKCVAGHQANLYPYGGFFAKAASVDLFVIVDVTQYVKKEYHNRNQVKLADGKAHWLRIPVKTAGRFTQRINEVEVVPGTNWQRDHRRTVELAYAKSRYFEGFWPPFRQLLEREWRRLVDYNVAVIRLCFELLGITTPVKLASELGVCGRRTELILDICRKTGADAYLHGRHGRDYADFNYLKEAGVRSFIQEYTQVPYPQPWGSFVANLSILDILFNCGPRSLEVIMAGNRIVDAETGEVVREPGLRSGEARPPQD